ncbi:MAG: YicC/YloC family endoribonuclease [Pyrinomonadaceae bacterium]
MRSMTGFGRGAASGDNFSVTVELKTVNNRFLDINLKMGSDMQAVEAAVKRTISDRLHRGRVEVNLQYDRTAEVSYELNRPLISGFISAMKEIRDEFGLPGEPDINVVARIPNVMSPRKVEVDGALVSGIENALLTALDDLQKMRESEGAMLKEELSARLASIEALVPAIADAAGSVAEEYRQKLTKKIGDMLAKSESQIELDQARLAQEVAYLADRADISEEIARLTAHIEHFRQIMDEESDVGKRLDFLTQELNREANTITSKTGNMTVKENALKIKSEIEKIREQVQNVE